MFRKLLVAMVAIPLCIGCSHPPRQKVVLCLESTVNLDGKKGKRTSAKIPVGVRVEYHLYGQEEVNDSDE